MFLLVFVVPLAEVGGVGSLVELLGGLGQSVETTNEFSHPGELVGDGRLLLRLEFGKGDRVGLRLTNCHIEGNGEKGLPKDLGQLLSVGLGEK